MSDTPSLISPDGKPIGSLEEKIAVLEISLKEMANMREELLFLLRAITRRAGGEIIVPFDDIRDCCFNVVPIKIVGDPGRGGVVITVGTPQQEEITQ